MKNLGLSFVVLFITSVLLVGCGNNPSSNTNTNSSVSSVEKGLLEDGVADVKNGDASLSEAIKMAQLFVKSKVGGSISFNNSEMKGCEAVSAIKNRFKVFQEYTLTDQSGNSQKYLYKTYVQFFGGDKDALCNWDYGVLTIENRESGEQTVFRGKMKERDLEKNSTGTIVANGITFNILKQNPGVYVRLGYNGNLNREQIAKVLEDLQNEYDYQKYILYSNSNTENPKIEYQPGDKGTCGVYDYTRSKTKVFWYFSLDDYRNNKLGMDLEK
jgi:hypothetical protein